MIEGIQVAAEAMSAASNAAVPHQQASAFDVRDFAAALERSGGAAGQPSTAKAGAVAAPVATQPSEGMRSVLMAFDHLNSGADTIGKMAAQVGKSNELNPGAILDLTVNCQKFMFQCELTSNVANRTSDGISQLFRQQS